MNAPQIISIIIRVLLVIAAAITAAMSQYDDDIAETGKPRWLAIGLFALLGAIMAIASSFHWIPTLVALELMLIPVWFCKGRADNIAGIVVWMYFIYISHLFLAGQPFVWLIGDTIVSVAAVVTLALATGRQIWLKKKGQLPQRPHEGEPHKGNPFVVAILITSIVIVNLSVALIFIG